MPIGAAIFASAAIGAVGTIASAAMQPGAPGTPDLAGANAAGIEANAKAAAYLRRLEVDVRLGQPSLKYGYTSRELSGDEAVQSAQQAVDDAQRTLAGTPQTVNAWGPQHPGQNAPFGVHGYGGARNSANPDYQAALDRYNRAQQDLTQAQAHTAAGKTVTQYFDKDGKAVNKSDAFDDFTGRGDADVAAVNAKKNAQSLLDLQQQFGPQFITTLKDQLKLADPEGVAAREKMFEIANQGVNEPADTRMAQSIQDQIQSDLDANANGKPILSPDIQNEVEQSVRRAQAARGNALGNAPTAQESMTIGSAGEALKSNRQAKALAFLQSGQTPYDIRNLSLTNKQQHLQAALTGQTPIQQFGQLANGGGVVPFNGGAAIPSFVNPNAGQQGVNNAFTGFDASMAQYNANARRPNPWTTGLSTFYTGVGAAAKAGWNPFAAPAPTVPWGTGSPSAITTGAMEWA